MGMTRQQHGILGCMIIGCIMLLDYMTKHWAMIALSPYQPVAVCSFLNWTLAFNTGTAFSWLDHAGPWHQIFLTCLSFGMSLGLGVWMYRLLQSQCWLKFYALSLIIGGALGNGIDRMRLGYVIDFIDVYYRVYHWPVFNLADSAICCGACLFLMMEAHRS